MRQSLWKQLIAVSSVVSLLMAAPGVAVLAEESKEEILISVTNNIDNIQDESEALTVLEQVETEVPVISATDESEVIENNQEELYFHDESVIDERAGEDNQDIIEECVGSPSAPTSKPKISYAGQVVDSLSYRGVTTDAVYTPYRSGLDTDWTYGCFVLVRNFYSNIYGITVSNLVSTSAIPNASSGYFYETRSPRVGDIVRFNNTVHWALVKSIDGSTVTLIQQNAWWNSYTCAQVGVTVGTSDTSVSFFTYSGYLPDNPGV